MLEISQRIQASRILISGSLRGKNDGVIDLNKVPGKQQSGEEEVPEVVDPHLRLEPVRRLPPGDVHDAGCKSKKGQGLPHVNDDSLLTVVDQDVDGDVLAGDGRGEVPY